MIRKVNSEFNNIVGDPNAYIEKKDVEIVAMYPEGNCFYRSISYFLFNNQKYYQEIKNLIIEWIQNNYNTILNFFGEDEIKNILSCIDSYIQSYGKPVILQTDNGLEFSNSQLNNYCINNDIKNIHGLPKHPQSQGACESCHKEIKKYI